MSLISKVFQKIYLFWVVLVFSVFMIILLPLIILPILLGQKYGNITFFALYLWSKIFSILNFIHYKIIGADNIDKKQSYIYTSNHTSFLDIPGLTISIPTQFRPLAKKELLKAPIFGLIVKVVTVVVDRSSADSRRESINILKKRIHSGISLLIFPEGTQNRTEQPLQPFYDGAFRLAIETQTPVLPMVIVNAGKLMPPTGFSIRPGKIKVVFGEPIDVSNYTMEDTPKLKTEVFNIMQELLKKHPIEA